MGGWKIPLNLIDFFYFEVRYFYFHLYKTNIYLEYLFSLCWMEFFPRYNSRRGGGDWELGIGIRMSWLEKFLKITQRGRRLLGTKE